MRDGTCAKCGGSEVYAAANALAIGSSAQAALHAHIEPGFRGMRSMTMTNGLWSFLCGNCGHLELYVLDGAAVEFARQHWVRVQPPAAG